MNICLCARSRARSFRVCLCVRSRARVFERVLSARRCLNQQVDALSPLLSTFTLTKTGSYFVWPCFECAPLPSTFPFTHIFSTETYLEQSRLVFANECQKTEVATVGGAFGELCLFPNICKYRFENAKATGKRNAMQYAHVWALLRN